MKNVLGITAALFSSVIPGVCVQAVISWLNRDTAKTQLETERLRRERLEQKPDEQ